MAIVTTDNKHYTDIASAIREATGDTELLKPEEMAAKIPEVKEAGRDIDPDWEDWSYFCRGGRAETLAPKIRYTDTSNATNTNYMFGSCTATEIPDLDVSNVTSAQSMFNGSKSLTKAPKLKFSSKCKDFSYMFSGCTSLSDISELQIGKNADTYKYMFSGTTSLNYLPSTWYDLSGFNNVNSLFYNSGLKEIRNLILTGYTNDLNGTFQQCKSLEIVENVDINKSNLYYTFANCTSLKTVHLINTGNTTKFWCGFSGCTALETIIDLDLSSATSCGNMLSSCSNLKNISFIGTIPFNTGIGFKPCVALTKASITNIINALATSGSGGSGITLSLTAVNNAFETSTGAADGSTSQEWLDLVATKPTRTISLS